MSSSVLRALAARACTSTAKHAALACPCRWARLGQWAASRDNASLSCEPVRSHWLGPHPCIGQSAARRPSSPLRINVLAHARAVSRKPHRHPSRCPILSAGSFARLGSLTRNSLRFSWSLSEMRPLRLLRASECVARRAAPGSCSAPRAQPRRGLDRAEQSIREHAWHSQLSLG